ncbi:MAG: hypothetical protein IJP16_04875 [Clostridia bacterium]|nr:hypothetical protein [Clostridia bacterium]
MITKEGTASFITRVSALFLCLAMLLGVVPTSLFSVMAMDVVEKLATVSTITDGGVVNNPDGADVNVTYNGVTLEWAEADLSIGRPIDGWWVGVKVTAPDNLVKETDFVEEGVDKVTYRRIDENGDGADRSFWYQQSSDKSVEETERYVDMWLHVNEEKLNNARHNGGYVTYKYEFNWNNDSEYEQTLTINIAPNLVLEKEGESKYPSSDIGTVETISDGLSVSGDSTAHYVQVSNTAPVVLDWMEKDTSLNINADGWWMGIKVIAPTNDLDVLKESRYQVASDESWSAAKSFYDSKSSADDDSSQYISLWGLLSEDAVDNAVLNNEKLSYTWRFDWDNDGVYEQLVTLVVDPEEVTLVRGSNEEFGGVEAITEAQIRGSGTASVTVKSGNLNLNWDEADESIGRYKRSWWVGAMVYAPTGIDLTEENDVKYQSKKHGGEWSADKSFWANQDSPVSADTHYMGVWAGLDRDVVEAAAEAGEDIVYEWRFDWNRDGVFEQTVSYVVDADTVVLNRYDREDIVFTKPAESFSIWSGEGTYTVAASCTSEGDIVYSIDSDKCPEGTSIDSNGVVTFSKPGKITVRAEIPADDFYNSVSEEITFEVVRNKFEGLAFVKPESKLTTTYEKGLTFTNVIDEATSGGGSFTYSIAEQADLSGATDKTVAIIDAATGVLTIYRTGNVYVVATRQQDDKYDAASVTYSLEICKGTQSLEFENKPVEEGKPIEITYKPGLKYTNVIKNNKTKATYAITETCDINNNKLVDGDVAVIDTKTGELTVSRSGIITVTATCPSDDNYQDATAYYKLAINKADQTNFGFSSELDVDGDGKVDEKDISETNGNAEYVITYNDFDNSFVKLAAGGQISGNITYEIADQKYLDNSPATSDSLVAEINEDSGLLTVYRSGKILVRATKKGDDCYNDVTAEYTLTVNKCAQTIEFWDNEASVSSITRLYGIREYTPVIKFSGSGAVTYSISPNKIGADIDEATGVVTFKNSDEKVGTARISVSIEPDERYLGNSNWLDINVEYHQLPSGVTYTVSDRNKNGWYRDEMRIEAPAGYLISYHNELDTNDWSEVIKRDIEGTEKPEIFFKHETTGAITDSVVVEEYQMDKTDPEVIDVKYETPIMKTIAEKLFGFSADGKVTVTVTAKDELSGIERIEYSLDGIEYVTLIDDLSDTEGVFSSEFVIDSQYRNEIIYRTIDKAGRYSNNYKDGSTIIIDKISPELEISYLYSYSDKDESEAFNRKDSNGIVYTNADKVLVQLKLTADNFDLLESVDNLPVVNLCKIGEASEGVKLTWNTEESTNINIASFEIEEEGDYVITVDEFTDFLDRKIDAYSQEIHVDRNEAEFSEFVFSGEVKYDDQNTGRKYYEDSQTVTVEIDEHSFDANGFEVSLVAKDYAGNDIVVSDYTELFKNAAWEKEGDKYTASFVFDKEANYTLQVKYTDLAGNESSSSEYKFTVDGTKPAQPRIYLDRTPFVTKVLSQITFGFFKSPLSFTVESSDLVAGVKSIRYAYVGTTGVLETGEVNVSEEITAKTDSSGVVKITFEIPGITDDPANSEFHGKVSAVAYDYSGNDESSDGCVYYYDGESSVPKKLNTVVTDNIEPERTVAFSEPNRILTADLSDDVDKYEETDNVILYYNRTGENNNNATVTITITEANFDENDVSVKVNSEEYNKIDKSNVNWSVQGNVATGSFTLEEQGDYTVTVEYTDASRNDMPTYISQKIAIDRTKPEIEIFFDPADVTSEEPEKAVYDKYFDESRTAKIVVTEHNFRPNEIVATVDVTDYYGNVLNPADHQYETYSQLFTEALKNAEWAVCDNNPDKHYAEIDFVDEGWYNLKVDYTDILGNEAEQAVAKEFVIDGSVPEVSISQDESFINKIGSTILFYNASPTVTIKVQDNISGIDSIHIDAERKGNVNANSVVYPSGLVLEANGVKRSGDEGFIDLEKLTVKAPENTEEYLEISFKIPPQFNGTVKATAVNMSGGQGSSAGEHTEYTVVVDTLSPKIEVKYTGDYVGKVRYDGDLGERFVYSDTVTANLYVNEANFQYDINDITVIKNGKAAQAGVDYTTSIWGTGRYLSEYAKVFKFIEDGDYKLSFSYIDYAGNSMSYTDSFNSTGKRSYVSKTVTVDKSNPVYTVTYDNNKVINTIDGVEYYDDVRTATIEILEHNFNPTAVDFKVTAKDSGGKTVTEYKYPTLKTMSEWKRSGDTWTATVAFDCDANYTVELAYKDIAGNELVNSENGEKGNYIKTFAVDRSAPYDLKIEYLEPSALERLIDTVSFRFFNSTAKVRISAEDITSGIQRFEYSYKLSNGVSDINAELIDKAIEKAEITQDGNRSYATFEIPAELLGENNQFRGNVCFTAYDYCLNGVDKNDEAVTVVDSVTPKLNVAYAPADAGVSVRYVDASLKDTNSFANAVQAFYGGKVKVTLSLNEANFFEGAKDGNEIVHELGILLTETDNEGNTVKLEYLPKGAEQMFSDETSETRSIVWSSDKDMHTAVLELSHDADYKLEIKYTDYSDNDAEISSDDNSSKTAGVYTSKLITVDNTDPVVEITYSNNDVSKTVDGRRYYDAEQIATVTVKEHNFRAADVNVDLIAKNILGDNVEVADFDSQLRDDASWKHYNSKGELVAKAVDGNVHVAELKLTEDANYSLDVEYDDLSKRVSVDKAPELFTVDTTAPVKLSVEYNEPNMWNKILENITLGFYNAHVTVTVSAEDITSGIDHFIYSYINVEGASAVNAQLIEQAIESADIVYNGATAVAEFAIPKDAIEQHNQFNGTIEFTAYDRSLNSGKLVNNEVIIVDNIKPEANVTFNEPVQTVNGIRYYNSNINASIIVNEANFYSEDVVVSITRNGAYYAPNISWTDTSADVHRGAFTLTEEGSYTIRIDYTDRSSNKMDTYVSERIVIDKVMPEVHISNVKANSANKDEIYGFTVTVRDDNADINAINTVLTAVMRAEDGTYETKDIPLGDVRTVSVGTSYSYVVENLEADAVYTITSSVKDMSGNENTKILLDDGNEYDEVKFSINRNGSTFSVNGEIERIVDAYYVYSVDEDIVIEEINVDPIENYIVRINGNDLVENTDYTSVVTSNEGEWSKRSYIVSKDKFAGEGEYDVMIESVDKTETTAYSDIKKLKVAFVVDRTAPVVTISGLESGGRYQVEEQTVTAIPTDEGGKLDSFKAVLLDDDGKEVKTFFEASGTELVEYLEANEGKITFNVPEGIEHSVRIICNDSSVNSENSANVYDVVFDKVTVSQNRLVMYYANKPLLYGSIGTLAVAAGVAVLVIIKKKKKVA